MVGPGAWTQEAAGPAGVAAGAGVEATDKQRRSYLPLMTGLLIAVCVAVYAYDTQAGAGLAQAPGARDIIGGEGFEGLGRLTLFQPSLEFNDEWYRLLTSGFVHSGAVHLGMNMGLLWLLGRLIEGTFGALSFGTLFVAGVLGGSVGALLLDGQAQVGGASGAIFALMGAAMMIQLLAGQNILRNGMAPLIAVNVAFSFLPFVSLGGHLGGLMMGLVAGTAIGLARRSGRAAAAGAPVIVAGLGFVALVLSIAIADPDAIRAIVG